MSTEVLTSVAKRKQSEEPEAEQSPKRAKLSPGKPSPEAEAETERAAKAEDSAVDVTAESPVEQKTDDSAKRKTGKVDEKQRSRRLFGSLLGTLGQGAGDKIKKRQEIEDRRKAELRRQDDARSTPRTRDDAGPTRMPMLEQWQVDEEDMRIRHRAMRHKANFLQTTAMPKLYYRPWDLTRTEEELLEEQRQKIEDWIDDEIEEFEAKRDRPELKTKGTSDQTAPPGAETAPLEDKHSDEPESAPTERPEEPTNGESEDESKLDAPSDSSPAEASNKIKVARVEEQPSQPRPQPDIDMEDTHRVDGEEDAVLY